MAEFAYDMCLTPVTLWRPVNGTRRHTTDIVPCGKCPECLKRRSNAWAFRLYQEMRRSSNASFLTLTYEKPPLSVNGLPTLVKKDFQDFMKRLRKLSPRKYNSREKRDGIKPLKYYACGEYGGQTARPHYHAIMFNHPELYRLDYQLFQSHWKHGIVSVDECNMATIHYVTKYITKGTWKPLHELDDRLREFSLMSKKMGLDYLTKEMTTYMQSNEANYVTMPDGWKMPLPKYFKEKLYTENQRKVLSIRALRMLEEEKPMFKDERHKIVYTKDQFRKAEKIAREQRMKL